MKIPKTALTEIRAAQRELKLCTRVPSNAFVHITKALKHASEAQEWIAARMLLEKYGDSQEGAKR